MKKLIFILVLTTTFFVSCKKEKFPDIDDLSGSWIEQTDHFNKHKLIFNKEVLIFIKPTSIDTFSYHLDKKQELIFLTSSIGESNHKVLFDKKENKLSIWDLLGGLFRKGNCYSISKRIMLCFASTFKNRTYQS